MAPIPSTPSPQRASRRMRALLGSTAILGLAIGVAVLSRQVDKAVVVVEESGLNDCPSGTRRAGDAPPTGSAWWCERDDGTKHGPSKSWYESGQGRDQGSYSEGVQAGEWTRWSLDGKDRVGTVEPAVLSVGAHKFRMLRIDPGLTAIGTRDRQHAYDKDHARHHVQISQSFLLGATEVTQGLWTEIMGENPTAERCPGAGLGPRLPVACVSFIEAARFANHLSKRQQLRPAYTFLDGTVQWKQAASGYRLPTNAEWEYAAQAGLQIRFAGTDEVSKVCRYGNVDSWGLEGEGRGKNSWSRGACLWGDFRDEKPFMCEDDHPGRAEVASFQPNRWGLFDMTGNVSEWVWDRSEQYTRDKVVNPTGPDESEPLARGRAYSGMGRVFRGGGWDTCPRRSQLHFRSVCPEGVWACRGPRPLEIGLRLARSVRPG
jgi:formylglycine-generating enzyme required for sulfatase activity